MTCNTELERVKQEAVFPLLMQRIEIDLCIVKLEFYNFLAVVNIDVKAEINF